MHLFVSGVEHAVWMCDACGLAREDPIHLTEGETRDLPCWDEDEESFRDGC